MNEIAKNPEYDNLLSLIQQLETELAELVQDRDKLLFHTCPKLQTEYMLKIGKLEYAVFEYQCKILKTKKIERARLKNSSYGNSKLNGQVKNKERIAA